MFEQVFHIIIDAGTSCDDVGEVRLMTFKNWEGSSPSSPPPPLSATYRQYSMKKKNNKEMEKYIFHIEMEKLIFLNRDGEVYFFIKRWRSLFFYKDGEVYFLIKRW